jgi:hypothetical protein
MSWLNPRKIGPGVRQSFCRLARFAIPAAGCLFATLSVQAQTTTSSSSTDISPGASSVSTRVNDGFSSFFEGNTQYWSWRGSRGPNVFEPVAGKGSQFYSPFLFGFDYQVPESYRLQVRAKTGYVHSNNATPGQQASIDTMIDTQTTFTWTDLSKEDYRTFVGLALNLPSGRTYLPNNLRFTRMDPDLVGVGSYGTGFNINPTAGVVFAATENTAVSVSAGYAWQGAFTRETLNPSSIPACPLPCPQAPPATPSFDAKTRIDPGDVFTANINTSSIFGNLGVKSSFAYMPETDLKQDGVPIGRQGAKYVANLQLQYLFDQHWSIILNGSWSYTRRNKVPAFPDGAPYVFQVHNLTPATQEPAQIAPLVWERKNSNSNVVIGSIEPVYAISERMSVSANYSVLWRDQNYYDFTEQQFIPSKLKQSVGGSWSYVISPGSSITVRGSYFWVHVDPGPFIVTAAGEVDAQPVLIQDTQSYNGWFAMIGGSVRF